MKGKNVYEERNQITKEKLLENRKIGIKNRITKINTTVFFLVIVGLMSILSASYYNSGMKTTYITKQAMYIVIGLTSGITLSKIDYRILQKNSMRKLLILSALITLALMPVLAKILPSVVPEINGSNGWIKIPGIGGLQPAELFKVIFVIALSISLSESEKKGDSTKAIIIKNSIVPMLFFALIFLQKDMGTMIHYIAIFLVMMFMTAISGKLIAKVAALGIAALSGLFVYVYNTDLTGAGYKLLRIKSFLVGLIHNYYDNDKGYQVRQSLIGLGRGGILGVGYSNGIQKYSYLPEIHTDFIFTAIGEEWGFLGALVLVIFFLSLFNRMSSTAYECDDYFGKYLSVGLAAQIFTQFLINISVTIGLIPVFGIPMPFISYGGSSIITVLSVIGIIISINKTKLKELSVNKRKLKKTKVMRSNKVKLKSRVLINTLISKF